MPQKLDLKENNKVSVQKVSYSQVNNERYESSLCRFIFRRAQLGIVNTKFIKTGELAKKSFNPDEQSFEKYITKNRLNIRLQLLRWVLPADSITGAHFIALTRVQRRRVDILRGKLGKIPSTIAMKSSSVREIFVL